MGMTRREFMAEVAVAAVLPLATSPAPASTVTRSTMWSPDHSAEETLARCNRLLASNPDDVLALVHRGQIPSIYYDTNRAWTDLTKAISLEPTNPCCWYLRGTCDERPSDLRHAINLLLANGDLTGTAICSSIPDYYNWQGTETGEMTYLSLRELGYAEEQAGRFDAAIAAYKEAAAFETISVSDLKTWAESSFAVGLAARAWVEFDRLIAIEPRPEFVRRREECWARSRR